MMKDLFSISGDKFLGIEFYDEDIYRLILRFLINFIFTFIIIRVIYYPTTKRKEYAFTYALINTIVFFLCFMLKKIELNIGLALGLFAIFGIIRYRTNSIPIREMTYLFLIIGIGVLNALINKKISYVELAFFNIATIIMTLAFELWLSKDQVKKQYKKQKIDTTDLVYQYTNIVRPENQEALLEDLKNKTGLDIVNYKIEKYDFSAGVVHIKLSFKKA